MDKRLHLLTALGALTLGAAITTAPSIAAKFAGVDLQSCVKSSTIFDRKTEADCACEAALDNGRPEVLAKFFKKYASQAKNTACAALASTKVRAQTGNGNPDKPLSGNGASGGD